MEDLGDLEIWDFDCSNEICLAIEQALLEDTKPSEEDAYLLVSYYRLKLHYYSQKYYDRGGSHLKWFLTQKITQAINPTPEGIEVWSQCPDSDLFEGLQNEDDFARLRSLLAEDSFELGRTSPGLGLLYEDPEPEALEDAKMRERYFREYLQRMFDIQRVAHILESPIILKENVEGKPATHAETTFTPIFDAHRSDAELPSPHGSVQMEDQRQQSLKHSTVELQELLRHGTEQDHPASDPVQHSQKEKLELPNLH